MTTESMAEPLAGMLGRVAAAGDGQPYDDVRLALLDALLEAKRQDALEHESWQRAFDHAVRSLRLRVIDRAEQALREAAARSRYPVRRLETLLPDAEAADAFLHRLLAEGMPLERLEGEADTRSTRRARALALETAWEGALTVAGEESARWQRQAAIIAGWRRPLRPLWIGSVVLLLITLVLAGWLGGELPAPGWFRPIGELWWSLPWP